MAARKLRRRPGDQPVPTPGREDVGAAVIVDLEKLKDPRAPAVIQAVRARIALGIQRYGTPLQTFNGRSALQDATEELLDAQNYLKQLYLETDSGNVWRLYQIVQGAVLDVFELTTDP